MANFQPSSFIPEKPTGGSGRKSRSGSFLSGNILLILAGIIFTVSILGAIGVFLYQQYSDSQLDEVRNQLERARNAFEPELIRELQRLDTRIDVASDLLEGHVALTPFFDELESATLETVQFTDFSFSQNEEDGVRVSMQGAANGYASVALQSDTFGDNENFQNPIFSNFQTDENGDVTFDVIMNLDESLVLYSNTVNQPASAESTNQGSN